jgi:hypothetical protein
LLRPTRRMSSISRNVWINLEGPPLDASRKGFRALDSLLPQPYRCVQAANPVVTITNHFFIVGQGLNVAGQSAKRNQLRSLDTADLIFPGFANIHEQHFFALIEALLQFHRQNLEIPTQCPSQVPFLVKGS